MSQAELWLEIVADDAAEAAHDLAKAAGVTRCDEIEPLPEGGSSFWITSPAAVVHLVGPGDTTS